MKKLLTILFAALLLCACTAAAPQEPDKTRTLEPAFGDLSLDEGVITKGKVNIDISRGMSLARDLGEDESSYKEFIAFVEDILYGEIPEDAYYPAVKYIEGEWVYTMLGDEAIVGVDFQELGTAEISLNYDKETMLIDLLPVFDVYNGEPEEVTEGEEYYEIFEGGMENNGFTLNDSDGCIMYVTEYFDYEGAEFVIARLFVEETVFVDILFMRGQE